MLCPYCSFNVEESATKCPQCHIPLDETAAGGGGGVAVVAKRAVSSSVKENVHHWVWMGGVGAILTGLPLLAAYGLGIPFIIAGIATLAITGFGTKWNSLSGGRRSAALPGVVLGVAVMALLFVGFGVVIFGLKMFAEA